MEGTDADSVAFLADEVKTFRAKVIAHLMTPPPRGEGLNTFDLVAARLEFLLSTACQKLFDLNHKPEYVTINTTHVQSWQTVVVKMDQDAQDEYRNLFNYHVLRATEADPDDAWGPQSVQFEVLYKSELDARKQRIIATHVAMEELWQSFERESGVFWYSDGDIGRLLMNAWNTTSGAKEARKDDLFRIITRIWTEAGTDEHIEAAKKWCRSHGFNFKDML